MIISKIFTPVPTHIVGVGVKPLFSIKRKLLTEYSSSPTSPPQSSLPDGYPP